MLPQQFQQAGAANPATGFVVQNIPPGMAGVAPVMSPLAAATSVNKRPKGSYPGERYVPAGPPEIMPQEIEKLAVLGDGSFGTVYQGRCRSKDVAVKVLHKQDLDAKTLAAFRKEVEILSQIYHPNIVLFMGACTQPGSMCIVTELMPKGDVESMLQDKNSQLTLLQRMKMAKDAALGMAWLHGSQPVFIHRDLKTANLLVDANLNVKVCDFGLSQIKPQGENLRDGSEGAKGTPLWMAPEVMMGQPFNEKADIYSFGIVLWEILTKSEPFQEFESFEEFRTAVCYHHKRPPIADDTNPKLRRLIERCWHSNPSVRPAFSEIVECLDEIILEIAINDEYGRKMWNDCFKKKDSVKWADFRSAFAELLEWSQKHFKRPPAKLPQPATPDQIQQATATQLEEFSQRSQENYLLVAAEFSRRQRENVPLSGLLDGYFDPKNDELNFKCLKAVLAENSQFENEEDMVSMDRFGKVLAWFGPLVDMNYGVIILDKIRLVLAKRYFHGDISTREAEIRLVSKGVGAYLVRFSTSAPGTYTLSKVSRDGSINHQRILYQPGTGFIMHTKVYPSLDQLIQGEAAEMGLVQACLGSKYSSLFMDIHSQGYLSSTTPHP